MTLLKVSFTGLLLSGILLTFPDKFNRMERNSILFIDSVVI